MLSCSSVVEHPNKQSEGLRFDTCWENSDFPFLTMALPLTEKIPALIYSPGPNCSKPD